VGRDSIFHFPFVIRPLKTGVECTDFSRVFIVAKSPTKVGTLNTRHQWQNDEGKMRYGKCLQITVTFSLPKSLYTLESNGGQ
jgi:hypothetical protein